MVGFTIIGCGRYISILRGNLDTLKPLLPIPDHFLENVLIFTLEFMEGRVGLMEGEGRWFGVRDGVLRR